MCKLRDMHWSNLVLCFLAFSALGYYSYIRHCENKWISIKNSYLLCDKAVLLLGLIRLKVHFILFCWQNWAQFNWWHIIAILSALMCFVRNLTRVTEALEKIVLPHSAPSMQYATSRTWFNIRIIIIQAADGNLSHWNTWARGLLLSDCHQTD